MPRLSRPAWAALALLLLPAAAPRAAAGVLVIGNASGGEVTFSVRSHPGAAPVEATLSPGESRPFAVGKQPDVTFTEAGKPVRYRLEPYAAYLFGGKRASAPTFQGIEYTGPLPAPDDVPDAPAPTPPVKVAVKLLADDADRRAAAVWQKELKARVEKAADIVQKQCGVQLEVTATDEWASDPEAEDMQALLRDFERKVRPGPAAVAIGFTSRPAKPPADGKVATIGCTRGPLHTHVLIREGQPKTEPERVEVLVHELGHLFGAAHTPDPLSAMRAKLGDGLATNARYKMSFDPLNQLAANVWAEELRTGKVRGWGDLRPKARERLKLIYSTIRHVLPDDPVADEYVGRLDGLAGVVAAADPPADPPRPADKANDPPPAEPVPVKEPAPMKDPAPPPARRLSDRQEAVRKVVRAVALKAADLHAKPAADRPKGDALTAEYVRTAADVAATLGDDVRAAAFLLGLGVALDDSTVLRDNLISRDLCRAVETDDERRERVAVLGVPTARGRRDLCQHFAVSAALAELVGPTAAEAAGLLKEKIDLGRASGFSFADLAADFAGVRFAGLVKEDVHLLGRLRDGFAVADYVPEITGLREGLTEKRFADEYGSETDPRFARAMAEVRKRVEGLPK